MSVKLVILAALMTVAYGSHADYTNFVYDADFNTGDRKSHVEPRVGGHDFPEYSLLETENAKRNVDYFDVETKSGNVMHKDSTTNVANVLITASEFTPVSKEATEPEGVNTQTVPAFTINPVNHVPVLNNPAIAAPSLYYSQYAKVVSFGLPVPSLGGLL